MSALVTQCLGDTVQTRTGKVGPARKFKYTMAARVCCVSLIGGVLNVNVFHLNSMYVRKTDSSAKSKNKTISVFFVKLLKTVQIQIG